MARPPHKYRKLKCSFCEKLAVRTTDDGIRFCKGHYEYQKANLSIKRTPNDTWAVIVHETPGYLDEFTYQTAAIFRAFRFMGHYNSSGSILTYDKNGENITNEIFFVDGKHSKGE